MSVRKDTNGRRFIDFEVELPGTPDDIWQALATGPGISAWFVPTTLEEADGKPVAVTLDFGGGMVFRHDVTAWNPPSLFVREGPGWVPGSPPIAAEFHIEARAGGVCVVRVVQSLFASTDDWDGQLTGAEEGWPAIIRILRLYLAHFRGMRSAIAKVMVPVPGSAAEAWTTLTSGLGLTDVREGERWSSPAGVPAMSGVVERVDQHPFGVLLRVDSPAPGIAALGTIEFGDMVMAGVTFYWYGDTAATTSDHEAPRWEAWMAQRFPQPAESETTRT
jgi:uncharacterized protein YndB with AHSA1/START domain